MAITRLMPFILRDEGPSVEFEVYWSEAGWPRRVVGAFAVPQEVLDLRRHPSRRPPVARHFDANHFVARCRLPIPGPVKGDEGVTIVLCAEAAAVTLWRRGRPSMPVGYAYAGMRRRDDAGQPGLVDGDRSITSLVTFELLILWPKHYLYALFARPTNSGCRA